MSDLTIARSAMALSLGFHIIFAIAGMTMPLLMFIAEGLWLKTGQEVYRRLAQMWAKGTAILFAVGAVSGTVLSFELGLLWPRFMAYAGPIIGMPFSLEGFAFFLEAVFLGIYLYGWNKVPKKVHWLAGFGVFASGVASGIFIMAANAWMNAPQGFEFQNGNLIRVDPWEAMFNPAFFPQASHMILAAFQAVGFAAAAIHAVMLKRDPQNLFHRKGFAISFILGAAVALLQPLNGDLLARHVAKYQPVKLAAMEGQWETERGAPLRIGGWPDEKTERTRFAISIPKGLSLLAFGDPNAEVQGLKSIPPQDRPPVPPVHLSFQIMVGCGMIMAAVALWGFLLLLRRRSIPTNRWFLSAVIASGPLGIIAIEAGWVVTEVGRQPWVIHNFLRTSEGVTPVPDLGYSFIAFAAIYLVLGFAVLVLMRRLILASPEILSREGK